MFSRSEMVLVVQGEGLNVNGEIVFSSTLKGWRESKGLFEKYLINTITFLHSTKQKKKT